MIRSRTFNRRLALLASALMLAPQGALANPLGGQVVGGTASIQGQGTATVTVTQGSQNAIINWNTFNIGAGELTQFNQPNASAIALNRVVGDPHASTIFGSLQANGRIFLINPNGVLIGAGATINTAGFLASTNDIRNEDFMAGNYKFNIPGRPDASIVNLGHITATDGGFAALVAPGVRNAGVITANLGNVALASGNGFTLDFYGDKLITLQVGDQIANKVIDVATGQTLDALVKNEGLLKANGGQVALTAVAARHVVDSVINNTGVIEANSVGTRNGMIVLGAATASTKGTNAPKQTVKVSGTLSASGQKKGEKGGVIQITGEHIQVAGAKLDASGQAGGGTVLIGGDTGGGAVNPAVAGLSQAQLQPWSVATASSVSIDAATVIDASAKAIGDGGKVVVWSDQATNFAGKIYATGGPIGGNGGFAEVSSHGVLTFTGLADLSAPKGTSGTLLLDPTNVFICNDDCGGQTMSVATLEQNLSNNNVLVTTTGNGNDVGNINVLSSVAWDSTHTLTLQAANDIHLFDSITANNGGLTLNAGHNISATGAVNVGTFTLQNGNWTQMGADLPAFSATDFRLTGGTFLRAAGGNGSTESPYQIVDAYGLQGIGSPSGLLLNKSFALANNIDASGTANWNGGGGFVPIGTSQASSFGGNFDGQQYVIDGLTIHSTAQYTGLFGYIGSAGVVHDVGLLNANVTATGHDFNGWVGALAGWNAGQITQSYATGSVSGGVAYDIGGLVARNVGSISKSYADVATSGGDNSAIGGLVGNNIGSISQSYSLGSVQAGSGSFVGGLVGWNSVGTIDQAYATGPVSAGSESSIGGLVGFNGGSVTASYWDTQATFAAGYGSNDGTFSATGLTTEQSYQKSSYVGWNFGDGGAWFMIDGKTRPFLQSEWSSTINNAHQLQLMAMDLGATYTLGKDINLGAALSNPSNMWSAQGFVPIGQPGRAFGGTFDGYNHQIDGLKIAATDPNLNSIGLFGANEGTIQNVTLTNVSITANPNVSSPGQFVGTLVGQNFGWINNVSASGQIDGNNLAGVTAGGLVGQNGMMGAQDQETQISNSHAAVTVTLGDGIACVASGCNGGWNNAGGLVGVNVASIENSYATGDVTVGANSFAGGLVGANQNSLPGKDSQPPQPLAGPAISDSWASGNVNSAGAGVSLGGLVGYNAPLALITTSYATGEVTSSYSINPTASCLTTGSCQFANVGGLVGQNQGEIVGNGELSLALTTTCGAGQACATGAVSVGAGGTAGGLVGFNDGIIFNAFAQGDVSGAAGLGNATTGIRQSTTLGGLAGNNQGIIGYSFASGNVGTPGVAFLQAGGLVGNNGGLIASSSAGLGNVQVGDNSQAGGLAGMNKIADACASCVHGDGYNALAGINPDGASAQAVTNPFSFGTIVASNASGNVTGGSNSILGGVVAINSAGTITDTIATGAVTGADNSIIGGFAAVNDLNSSIQLSSAAGPVKSTGPNSVLGGFVGMNGGTVETSQTQSAVTGTSNSYIGGFVGINIGSVTDSQVTGPASITTTGTGNLVGGFVGVNMGAIDPSTTVITPHADANNIVGGFAGANLDFASFNFGNLKLPAPSFPTGTISTDSTTSDNVHPFIGTDTVKPGFAPLPSVVSGCTDAVCQIFQTGILTPCTDASCQPVAPTDTTSPTAAQPLFQLYMSPNTPGSTPILINLTTGGPVSSGGGNGDNGAGGAKPNYGPPPGPGLGRTADEQQYSGVPPPNETRFLKGEVVIQVVDTIPVEQVVKVAQGLGMVLISTQHLDQTHRILYRFRASGKGDVRALIRAFEKNKLIASAEPNYLFVMTQSAPAPAAPAVPAIAVPPAGPAQAPAKSEQTNSLPAANGPAPDLANSDTASLESLPAGDAAQYVIDKLHLGLVHHLASGRNVTIAVVDSEIDVTHPDLRGVIVDRFDATQAPSKPHPHGTGMAGAIAAHTRLLGIAPGARIVAIKAFDESGSSAESSSYQIIKGLDYAVAKNVRIINMSFAGPRDPMMERTLKAAHDKGIILIAAAGNAGPKSPPLYPGADPSVIAVSATDYTDKPFAMANRGKYIAVAAPGVDVMVPAPGNGYQLTTGTSVAAANVSGVAALIVERDPAITPDQLRALLVKTATAFSANKPKGEEDGAGLVDPIAALKSLMAGAKTSDAAPSPHTTSATIH